MKILILLIAGWLTVGCGKDKQPVKELTLEATVGEYERKIDGNTITRILLDNGVHEMYKNGNKIAEYKLKIVNGEMHIVNTFGIIEVFRINKDSSITNIGWIDNIEKRHELSKKDQGTFKKIK